MCIYIINVLMMMSEMESSFFRVQKPSECTQREGFVMIRWTGLAPWEFEFPFLAPWGERKTLTGASSWEAPASPIVCFETLFQGFWLRKSAHVRREDNLNRFKDLYLEAKARIRP